MPDARMVPRTWHLGEPGPLRRQARARRVGRAACSATQPTRRCLRPPRAVRRRGVQGREAAGRHASPRPLADHPSDLAALDDDRCHDWCRLCEERLSLHRVVPCQERRGERGLCRETPWRSVDQPPNGHSVTIRRTLHRTPGNRLPHRHAVPCRHVDGHDGCPGTDFVRGNAGRRQMELEQDRQRIRSPRGGLRRRQPLHRGRQGRPSRNRDGAERRRNLDRCPGKGRERSIPFGVVLDVADLLRSRPGQPSATGEPLSERMESAARGPATHDRRRLLWRARVLGLRRGHHLGRALNAAPAQRKKLTTSSTAATAISARGTIAGSRRTASGSARCSSEPAATPARPRAASTSSRSRCSAQST